MINRGDLKYAAKRVLEGKWPLLLLALVIYGLIASACCSLAGIGVILSFPLLLGIIFICKDIINGKEVDLNRLFEPYKDLNKAANFVLTYLLMEVFTFLWSLLFVIPGIVKALSYSAAPYLLSIDNTLKPVDAINKSRKIMDGHKWELFVLYLSFIPNFLLLIITFGIYGIYFIPYFSTVKVAYFRKITGDDKVMKEEKTEDNHFDEF